MGTGIPTGFVQVLSWVQVREFVPVPILVPVALIHPYLGNFFFWFQQPQCVQTKHALTTHHQHHPSFHTKHQQTSLCCDECVIHVATPLPSLSTTTTTTHTCDHRWQLAISWSSQGLSRGRGKKRGGWRERGVEKERRKKKKKWSPVSPPTSLHHLTMRAGRTAATRAAKDEDDNNNNNNNNNVVVTSPIVPSSHPCGPPIPGQWQHHPLLDNRMDIDNVGGWQRWW